VRIIRASKIWNAHTHSKFSAKDAISSVADLVSQAVALNQPALGLTDHGNIAGSVQLYKQCQKQGIRPFPGTELYLVHNRGDKKAKRRHLTVLAYNNEGYRNLVNLSTLSHRNFHNKPLVDHTDLALLSEQNGLRGLAVLTGCINGFVSSALLEQDMLAAEQYLVGYTTWFDRCYVELMNHNIVWDGGITDDQVAEGLLGLADRVGVPCALTQDAHYAEYESQAGHDSFKRLVSFGSDPDDGVFLGDGFQLASDSWFEDHHHPARYLKGVDGLQSLLSLHDLEISQLDKYAYNIPFTVNEPQIELQNRCRSELGEKGLASKYQIRLDEELQIIADTGMAGYLMLVAEVTDWCRENKVFYQARGSAAGSMCCWLLGITSVDPLKWKLSFERFISRDRTKPPDIDLDVEHNRRAELVVWLAERFSVSQIGTWLQLKMSGDIDPETGETTGKGSLRVQYFARKRALGEDIDEWADVPLEDKEQLMHLDSLKTYRGYGVHAAGIILTSSHQEFDELVPQMYVASSKTFVSQYAMDDVEDLGLVKLDVLGLKTLSVLHKTMDNLDREVDLDWIPLTDRETYQNISKGKTDGVFQLEGWTARKGVRRLCPTKISDVIAAMALFRPATMDSGATSDYIHHKNNTKVSVVRHPILDGITKDTEQILLFQEQVISVLRQLGMDSDNLTKFLKAVKASNQNIGQAGVVIDGYKNQVYGLAQKIGMSDEDWEWLWQAVTGFAAYGFNRAHSTVYGLTAYRCAYLATHFPLEFFGALLHVAAGTDKENLYIAASKQSDIYLSQPDIERSGIRYEVDGKFIRRGLTSVKGVGDKAAQAIIEARPAEGFGTLKSFAEKVDHRKVTGVKPYRESGDVQVGVLGKLHEAGVLKSLEP
jgi:DNA polymerase-3 subunit alpha